MVYLKRKGVKTRTKLLGLLLCTGTLLGQQHSLDVGQDASLGYGDTSQELVQLLIIPESKRFNSQKKVNIHLMAS